MSVSWNNLPMFPSSSFRTSDVMLRSFICFNLLSSAGLEILTWFQSSMYRYSVSSVQYIEEEFPLPQCIIWTSCQRLDDCIHVGLFLDSLLYSWLHGCPCTSTIFFLLLWVCSITWDEALWCFEHCSFFSTLFVVVEDYFDYSWSFVFSYEF